MCIYIYIYRCRYANITPRAHTYITLGGCRAVKVSGFRNWVGVRDHDLDLEGYALCPGKF